MNIRTYSSLFSAKETPQPYSLACLVKWTKVYLLMGKPCWVLAYSALLVALFSGEAFEEMLTGLTWPCTLSPGWSVGWDESSAGADASPSEWCLVRALSRRQSFVSYRVLFLLNKWTLMTLVVELLQYFYAQNWFVIIFKFHYNILWCMKCVLLYSLDLPSCEFLLIWCCFLHGFNREFTRGTAKDCASWIRVALQQWLAHLIHFCWGGSAIAGIRA